MNSDDFTDAWDDLRLRYGIYLRLLEALPDPSFHQSPIQGMRAPAELVAHVSGTVVRGITLGIATGEILAPEESESDVVARLGSKASVLDFALDSWDVAAAAARSVGDRELAATVRSPWEMSFTGAEAFGIIRDEFMHHRGQLYAYSRAMAVAPPSMWRFDQNAPGFSPGGGG